MNFVFLISNNIEIQLSNFNISFGVRFENNLKNSVFNLVMLLVNTILVQSSNRSARVISIFRET